MKRKFWYYFIHYECPQCGRLDEHKERRYTKKPKNGAKRHEYRQEWCSCCQ